MFNPIELFEKLKKLIGKIPPPTKVYDESSLSDMAPIIMAPEAVVDSVPMSNDEAQKRWTNALMFLARAAAPVFKETLDTPDGLAAKFINLPQGEQGHRLLNNPDQIKDPLLKAALQPISKLLPKEDGPGGRTARPSPESRALGNILTLRDGLQKILRKKTAAQATNADEESLNTAPTLLAEVIAEGEMAGAGNMVKHAECAKLALCHKSPNEVQTPEMIEALYDSQQHGPKRR